MAAAAQLQVDLGDLVRDIEKDAHGGSAMTLVFWFPAEYSEFSLAKSGKVTEAQKKDFLDAMRSLHDDRGRGWEVEDVRHGDLRAGVGKVRKNIRFLDAKGNAYEPLGEDEIHRRCQDRPGGVYAHHDQHVESMGKNMRFLLFPAEGKNSERLADAKSKGSFVVRLNNQDYRWKLPLGSLLPPKQCPKCHEEV